MKKIVIIVLILLTSSFTFASGTVNVNITTDLLQLFQRIVEFLYLFFWPLLVVSGKLLSNKFVYGGAFHLDTILWQLWQAVRVIANYFIGFVFLYSIFVYFFKSESNFSWKKIFPKIVVAAIVANLSWFIIGVLLDISSLLIYACGDFAVNFKEKVAEIGNREKTIPILPMVYDGKRLYVEVDKKKYVPCVFSVDENGSISSKPVNGPCFALHGGTYVFYSKAGNIQENVSSQVVKLKIPQDNILFTFFKYMYTQFFIANNLSNTGLALVYFSKLFLFFLLIIPFFVLAIILMARILILWIVIPFSPLIFSAHILGAVPSNYKGKFVDIISLIFQPAYIMFMFTVGFVLIEAIYQMEPTKNVNKLYETFNIKKIEGKNEVQIGNMGLIKGNIANGKFANGTSWSTVFDYFSWLLVNLLSGFVLRSLVFTALKANKFTDRFVTTVDTFVKKTAMALPIFPAGQSVESLNQAWGKISTDLAEQRSREQYLKLQKLIDNQHNKDKESEESEKEN